MKKIVLILSVLFFAGNIYSADFLVGFSRGKPSAKQVILKAINEAETSIYLEAYQLTNASIITALISAKERGVLVKILVDRSHQNLKGNTRFVMSGIECSVDTKFRIMHNKVMIIDEQHVQTGSFNYSVSADKVNAENVIYIKNVPEIASLYKDQWNFLIKTTKPCVITK